MRIKDVGALKIWLKDTVSQISDAEPDDLAKYVVALLKKDKPEKELEDLCQRELQIFFRENTMEFLSELFSALRTESYIFEKTKGIKREGHADSPDRSEGHQSKNRMFSTQDDDKMNVTSKTGLHRADDKYGTSKQSRGENRDVRHRLGDVNSREYRRHRDDHERRDRRKRSRSRSPMSRRRMGAGRHVHEDPRSMRLKRRSRERTRSRERSWSRSPFTQSGFRSAKYFTPKPGSFSEEVDSVEQPKKVASGDSRSSSIDLKDDRDYKITVPLDNIMKNNQIPIVSHKSNSFKNKPDITDESPIPVIDNSVPSSGPSMVVMTAPPGSQPSLVQTAPPPLPLGFGSPPPPFPTKLIPGAQPIRPVVTGQPPPLMHHFPRFPVTGSLVPSVPMGLHFQGPHVILPKESTSRQVVGFGTLNSFSPFTNQTSVKSRLGIKVDGQSHRLESCQGSTLLINNIPPTLNNISSINQQFFKFGTITNIQVHYGGNPGSALVTFGSHSAAESAYNSSEPVFNNRFIEVLWHHDASKNSRVVLPETRRPVKERLGGLAPELKVHVASNAEPEAEKENEVVDSDNAQTEVHVTSAETTLKRTVVLMPSKNPPSYSASQVSQMPFTYPPPMKIRRVPSFNKKGELMKEVMKRKLELERKKRIFLEEQLKKQKSLLDELQKPGLSDEEKLSMKNKLKEMSFQSRKLKSELDGSMKMMKPTPFQGFVFPPNMPAAEMKKQILDAELDLMSKAKEGTDTAHLEKKIQLMKRQVSYLNKKQARKAVPKKFSGKPTNQIFRHQGKPQVSLRLLDRRPRQLIVSGFQPDKKNAVIAHLGRFGKMEKFEDSGKDGSILVTYSTRKEAEKVARLAVDFENYKLSFSWPKTSESIASQQTQSLGESQTNVRSKDEVADNEEEEEDDDDDDDSDTMIELMIEDDGTNDLVENSLIDGESLLSLR